MSLKKLKYKDLKIGINVLKEDYIVYKRLRNSVAQLVLTKGTKVMKTYSSEGKLRCDSAIVMLIIPVDFWRGPYKFLDSKSDINKYSHYPKTTYKMGKRVYPHYFDNYNIYNCCQPGIHFFCNEKKARRY